MRKVVTSDLEKQDRNRSCKDHGPLSSDKCTDTNQSRTELTNNFDYHHVPTETVNAEHLENVKCMYTNADNLLNKRMELETTVASLRPDIIAITEVLPKHSQTEVQKAELEMDGYDCFFKDGGRGVCTYINKRLKAVPVNELTGNGFEESV